MSAASTWQRITPSPQQHIKPLSILPFKKHQLGVYGLLRASCREYHHASYYIRHFMDHQRKSKFLRTGSQPGRRFLHLYLQRPSQGLWRHKDENQSQVLSNRSWQWIPSESTAHTFVIEDHKQTSGNNTSPAATPNRLEHHNALGRPNIHMVIMYLISGKSILHRCQHRPSCRHSGYTTHSCNPKRISTLN